MIGILRLSARSDGKPVCTFPYRVPARCFATGEGRDQAAWGKRDSLRLDWRLGNIRVLRARYEQVCRIELKASDEWRMLDVDGRRIRLLIHNAQVPSDRAMFYFHGGGWIVGSPSTHADITSALASTTGLPVVSVDYRLAPEFAAKAAIEDGLAVLHHFLGPAPQQYQSAILCGDFRRRRSCFGY